MSYYAGATSVGKVPAVVNDETLDSSHPVRFEEWVRKLGRY